jgi:hypothetical protein
MKFEFDIPYLISVAVLGMVLSMMGFSFTDWEFWCVIGLQWVAKETGQNSGLGQGRVETLAFLKMAETNLKGAQKLYHDLTGIDPQDYQIKD